jgi:tetratricopeptide (TPR) repeat protein
MPVLLLALVEGGLRLLRPDGGLPLFTAMGETGTLRMANRKVAARYFPAERFPPVPPLDPFAAVKPAGALRIFVLGESSTAGFPYPHNGTFSRVLRDVLGDVLPGRPVEVVNLGLAATNSYTLVDFTAEVLAQRPDLLLIYAGHNEYYGALGVGSSQSGAASPALKRLYLRLLRLRTVRALRSAVVALRRPGAGDGGEGPEAATFMEVLARDQQIPFGGVAYQAGLRQFEENLGIVLEHARRAGVPVLVASVASNVRDQPPFVSPGNEGAAGAAAVHREARAALASGDSARAQELFARARDLDVVRFRAPGELNTVVQRVAAAYGARYVPVAEAFDSASGGMPGRELFLEHVHPTREGQVLIARQFYEALVRDGRLGAAVRPERLRPWPAYVEAMALSPFDLRVVHHTLQTLMTSWPFVAADAQVDYRATYRPRDVSDSLALLVSRGGLSWGIAKFQLAQAYEERQAFDSAAAEYRGLARDAPFEELPLRMLARALLAAGRPVAAESSLVRAHAIRPTAYSSLTLGQMAAERREPARAVPYLEQAVQLDPTNPVALYSLSLAYGMVQDLPRARATADRVRALAPGFPGLAGWRRALGLSP